MIIAWFTTNSRQITTYMGHRSYLYLIKKEAKENLVIFEANNSLPFFWLTLIDGQSLQSKIKDWQKLDEVNEFASNNKVQETSLEATSYDFELDLETFKHTSSIGKSFVETHFLAAFPLYEEFIEVISTYFTQGDTLVIDIFELSSFYQNLDEFTETIINEVNAIEQGIPEAVSFLDTHDLIATGSGFLSIPTKDFPVPRLYQNALKNRRVKATKNKATYQKKSILYHVIILLICPVFTWVTFKGWQSNGFAPSVIFIGIANLIFYIYAIWEIVAQIKMRSQISENNVSSKL